MGMNERLFPELPDYSPSLKFKGIPFRFRFQTRFRFRANLPEEVRIEGWD